LRERQSDWYARRTDGASRASRVQKLLSAATIVAAAVSQVMHVEAPRRIVMLMHQSRLAPVRVVGVALAIAAATLVANIAAAKDRGAVSTVVNYSDLDLTHSADTARLYARLKYASHKVCNSYDSRELKMRDLYAACYDKALSSAVAEVDDARLSSLHAAEPRIKVARRS
jgi:UrcA family protein